jgi:ubiquitin carboxyl-terminal hydrolase 36/42
LSVHRVKTLEQALASFMATEVLDGDNKYRCPLNNRLVRAEKSVTIQEPPNLLTIHFKRFDFSMHGRDLVVTFPRR